MLGESAVDCGVLQADKRRAPEIVRRAKATAYYLGNKTIFIEDDELIVGNVASCPMGTVAGSIFDGSGKHIQFNVVDRKTLVHAQRHPERHRDLLTGVADRSSYFVHLTKAVQKEMILRTEVEGPGKEI